MSCKLLSGEALKYRLSRIMSVRNPCQEEIIQLDEQQRQGVPRAPNPLGKSYNSDVTNMSYNKARN